MSSVKIGVVGGGIRGSMFATAVQQHPDAELVGICELSDSVRDKVAGDLGVSGYVDVEDLIAAQRPDAMIIATPDFAHRDLALTCIRHGLALMIEKPLATTSADAEAIATAADAAGTTIMVGFENRWNPHFAQVQAELAAGTHGSVINQIAHLNDTVFVPTGMLSWAAQSSPAWFLMPHTLDLAIWLSGSTPREVFARGVRRVLPARGVDTWDAISASFAMADGSLLTLESQWVLPETAPSVFDFRYEVHTEKSSFRLDISDSGVHRYAEDGHRWLQFGVHSRNGRLLGIPIDMVGDFIDSLNGAALTLPDAHVGLMATRAIEAVHDSLQTGQPVPITAD